MPRRSTHLTSGLGAPRGDRRAGLRMPCTALVLGLSASLTGCASAPSQPVAGQFIATDFVPPPRGSVVLVLHQPARERADRHGDIEASRIVQDELASQGYRVVVLEPEDHDIALQAELRSLQERQAVPTPQQLQRAELQALALVSRVAADLSGSRLLLRTRLLTRPVTLWQSHATWDGVTRPIEFAAAAPGRITLELQGTATGVSVEATAVGPSGRLLFNAYGGIAPAFEIGAFNQITAPRRLFTREFLEDGVRKALTPLQPR